MQNGDAVLHFVAGIDPAPHGGTDNLRIISTEGYYGPVTVLQSYGVPIAARVTHTYNITDGPGGPLVPSSPSFFVDCFSQWSVTTSKHTTAVLEEIARAGHRVHRVDYATVNGHLPTAPAPKTSDRAASARSPRAARGRRVHRGGRGSLRRARRVQPARVAGHR